MPTQRQVKILRYFWHIPSEESTPIAKSHFEKIIAALTTPLSPEEINPSSLPGASSHPVKITAINHTDAFELFQLLFNETGEATGWPSSRQPEKRMI